MMNKTVLILIPLGIMFLLSTLSMLGLGTTTADFSGNFTTYDRSTSIGNDGTLLVLYGQEGTPLCYWNGTAIAGHNDNGKIIQGAASSVVDVAFWGNQTYASALYYDNTANVASMVKYTDTISNWASARSINPDNVDNFTLGESLTWVIIIGVLMTVGSLASIKVFSSGLGENGVKIVLTGTFALTIWGILTIMAYPLILEAGFYIFILYGFLGFLFTTGIFLTMVGD